MQVEGREKGQGVWRKNGTPWGWEVEVKCLVSGHASGGKGEGTGGLA